MSYYIQIALFSLVLFAFLPHNCGHDKSVLKKEAAMTPVEPINRISSSNESSFEECSEITRKALITHCGSCHQSSLPTHKPGAIAIFDLDKGENWHTSLDEENLEGISKRLLSKSSITEEQKKAVSLFLEIKEKQPDQ